jgi:DNA-binding transcriptional MerR regulator
VKIGEVAERTQVAPRLIRYYEQQGLLTPDRADNGYRTYTDEHVERVGRIAGLVQAGIPTRLVKVLLDAEDAAARDEPTCPAQVAEQLAAELGPLEARIACLTRSRDTIRTYLERTRHEALLSAHPSAPR